MPTQPSLEISVSPTAGFSAADGSIGEQAKDAFDALGALLVDTIEPFRRKLGESVASADELELTLALAFKGAGKWIVVSVEAGATVTLKLVWKRKP